MIVEARSNLVLLESHLNSSLINSAEKIHILTDIANFEIRHNENRLKAFSCLKRAQDLFVENKSFIKDYYGNDYVEVEKKILVAEMIILSHLYKFKDPKDAGRISDAITLVEIDSLNALCKKIEKFTLSYNIIQSEIPLHFVKILALTLYNLSGNATSERSPMFNPEITLKFYENALSLMQMHNSQDMQSILSVGIGSSCLRIAQSGKNENENWAKVEEFMGRATTDQDLDLPSKILMHRGLGMACQ